MKAIRITALILLLQTIVWVVFMAISTAAIEPAWEALDYVRWASNRGVAYVVNYVNVSLLTLVAVLLFYFLYRYLKGQSRQIALAGMILVPVYGLMNLFCYSIQIAVVPAMASQSIVTWRFHRRR